jgi:uncharacterized membrane protein
VFGIEAYLTETAAELISAIALFITWVFIQVVFAFYYAHEFYGKNAKPSNSGFVFPNSRLPDYWDFIRFAFVIGMRIQVPRVQVTSKKLRRVVIVQCIVSVILNTSIFVLAILIVARGIGSCRSAAYRLFFGRDASHSVVNRCISCHEAARDTQI